MKRSKREKSLLLLLVVGITAAGGCGTETYNRRIEETKELFDYINELNANLGSAWNNSGVEIRMPRQLTEIPPPREEPNEQGVMEQVGPDERQPKYSSVEFPGLIGAWMGNVEADVAGETKQVPAYAYVMSNAYLWAKGEPEEAIAFKDTLAQAVVDGLNLPLFEPEDWKYQNYPSNPRFVPKQSANVWVTRTERLIDETRAEVSLHLFESSENKNIQVAVLFVYPESISSREQMPQRIDLALQTIKISPELPAGVRSSAGGAAANPKGF